MSDIGLSETLVEIPDPNVLITTYYRCNSSERQKEIEFCLEKNNECKSLDTIILICQDGIKPVKHYPKVMYIYRDSRPTYREIFTIGKYHNADGMTMFCNSDIFITDEAIAKARELLQREMVIALSRWDWNNGNPELFNHVDSQDTWIWRGEIRKEVKADFCPGYGGCDNSIAYHLGLYYRVKNFAHQIKTYHVHVSGEHTYTDADRIPPPYKMLPLL